MTLGPLSSVPRLEVPWLLRKQDVSEVWDWLSPADIDHREKQVHFYIKSGYKVELQGDSGTIRKILK